MTRPVIRAIIARLVILRLRSPRRNSLLARSARLLVVLLLLPALLIAPIANGGAVLFHSHEHGHGHGDGHSHAHVLPSALVHGPGHELDEWHRAQHEPADHEHDDDQDEPLQHEPTPGTPPAGVLLKLSWSILPRTELRASVTALLFPVAPAFATATLFDQRAGRSAWREAVPPPRADHPGRSGTAAVLNSSHAVLI